MPDVFLYSGEPSPNDVRLSDPTVQRGGGGTAYVLTALVGSFTDTGQTASLLVGRKLGATFGTFSETGQNSSLLFGRKLSASFASFTESGQSATLLNGRKITAGFGAFTESGQITSLLISRKLTALAGSFTEAGQSASLLNGRILTAAVGSFTETGQDATFIYTSSSTAYTLTALAGLFNASGQPVDLIYTSTDQPTEVPPVGGGGGSISTWFVNQYGQSTRKQVRIVIDDEDERQIKRERYAIHCCASRFTENGQAVSFSRGVTAEQDESDLLELVEMAMSGMSPNG